MAIPKTERDILIEWGINPADFSLRMSQFRRQSHIHGIGHTYRVMILTLMIGAYSQQEKAGRLAFMAAYIHDKARTDDGISPQHGPDCARLVFPEYVPLFTRYGASQEELTWIQEAVAQHSTHEYMKRGEPGYPVMAILKDADALDRCRFGTCDVNRLRIPESCSLVAYAEDMFIATKSLPTPEPTLSEFLDWLPKNRSFL